MSSSAEERSSEIQDWIDKTSAPDVGDPSTSNLSFQVGTCPNLFLQSRVFKLRKLYPENGSISIMTLFPRSPISFP